MRRPVGRRCGCRRCGGRRCGGKQTNLYAVKSHRRLSNLDEAVSSYNLRCDAHRVFFLSHRDCCGTAFKSSNTLAPFKHAQASLLKCSVQFVHLMKVYHDTFNELPSRSLSGASLFPELTRINRLPARTRASITAALG